MANFALNSLLDFEHHKIALERRPGRAPDTLGILWLHSKKRPQSRGHRNFHGVGYLTAVTCDDLEVCDMGGRKMVKGINKGSLYSDANTSSRMTAI